MTADHIRYGLHPMPIGGEVTLTKWGWACLGCHGTLADSLPAIFMGGERIECPMSADEKRWHERHAAHASWMEHREPCNIRAGGACSCGRTT